MKTYLIFFIILSCFLYDCAGQKQITKKDLESIKTDRLFSYNADKGKYVIGADLGLIPLDVQFNKTIKISNDSIFLEGVVKSMDTKELLSGIKLFTGVLKNDEISINSELYKTDESGTFSIKIKIKDNERLYFAGLGYSILEFNIGLLN